MTEIPIDEIRREFPALAAAGDSLFFDNAAGAQIPDGVLAAVTDHLVARNVQRGGPYRRSKEVDAAIAGARQRVAALVNARSADEIAFGLNATSFIRAISLAVAQTLDSRSEIVVTELDHEANIATWMALERFGARIVWWKVRADGRLDVGDLERVVSDRTRLVACTVASNATGSCVDVGEVGRLAHGVGAEVFLDAVHFAPHGPVDVQAFGCDYLVCSGYKIFAPHMGFAWCRREAIDRLPTFREDFIPDAMPDKLEAGTYVYENVAGMDAAVQYLERLGRRVRPEAAASSFDAVRAAMGAIRRYEQTLSAALLDAVRSVDGAVVHGIDDRARLGERVPTVLFTVENTDPAAIAAELAARDVGVRSGHMYAPRLMQRLGLMPAGAVRASLVHYNTVQEVAHFGGILAEAIGALRAGPQRSSAIHAATPR